MLFRKLDFLSPPITFYHHGFLTHSSVISGIISITSIAIIISSAIYYSLELINRNDPKVFSFNSFTGDSGIFPMNSSSIFHFLSIAPLSTGFNNNGVDFSDFRIVGLEELVDYYIIDKNLSKREHWLYGKCNNISDTEGLGYLIDYDFFEKSACIRKYFSIQDQKYYDTDDPKFRWPEISHGTYHKDYKIYNIFIEKCQEDTVSLILGEGNHCKNFSELEETYVNYTYYGIAYFYYINQYIDVLNYENPNIKFFEEIQTVLNKYQYTLNNLNFNPILVKTHNGLIFDNIEEKRGHISDRNDVIINEGNDIFLAYIFWPKNTMNYHERIYKRIQDIISSIGGIYQFVTVIAAYLNRLYNNYVVLEDTQILIHSSINIEKNINKKNGDIRNIKDLEKEKKGNEIKNNSVIKKFNKNEITKINNSQSNNICITSYENININDNNKNKINKTDIKENTIDKENYINDKKKKDNFFDYLYFKLSCEKKKNYFKVYNNFRIKIISEENLIKNHLNVYNLLRINHKKKNQRINNYQIKDLIKLI